MRGLILAVAVAAITQPSVAGDPAAQVTWDSPYAGLQVGYVSADFDDEVYDYYGATATGLLLGGVAGISFHLSDIVVGSVEADLTWNGAEGVSVWDSTYSLLFEASLRGRLGLDLGRFMPYLTAGVAIARAQNQYSPTPDVVMPTGPTVGAGLEAVLVDGVTGRIEYRYTDFGTDSYGYDMHLKASTIRFGLNLHF